MAMNIFRSELLAKYAKSGNGGGEYHTRNGVPAMALSASTFYYGSGDERNYALTQDFKPGKRYVFDLWIDADNVWYEAGAKMVPAGISLIASTGGTLANLLVTGNKDNPIGWQHVRYISPTGVDIKGISVYYYISAAGFYRWDSTISEYGETNVTKDGIYDTGCSHEGYDKTSIGKGGVSFMNEIIEN